VVVCPKPNIPTPINSRRELSDRTNMTALGLTAERGRGHTMSLHTTKLPIGAAPAEAGIATTWSLADSNFRPV
jgi:hypothetical protein